MRCRNSLSFNRYPFIDLVCVYDIYMSVCFRTRIDIGTVLANATSKGTTVRSWLVSSIVPYLKNALFSSPLRRPEFALFCIANLFGDYTQYLPYIYLPDMMGSVGISSSNASYSMSIMAFSNMIGRIASGIVLDWSYINSFAFICLSFVSSGKYFDGSLLT